ncbi:cadmium-translocating P-type ATPase [Kibdelosporangium philippinense]|uniref:Cadmium-translocating P-type ATPase n=1 Tax=Kibdelosporangium philippinense TaxID=211113 RepID=A0ABS8Z9W9_9PSEU|nr:heavy metal translocating P-type ATPase [Kibdelosporangium philippinense]MCE7004656.1 cadmium-translocating P-type ATPase [Kibdelosporangium philippinense]
MSRLLLIAAVVALAAGALIPAAADALWLAGTVVSLVPAMVWAGKDLLHKRFGADLLAVFALAGTLLVGEYLAGVVIGVMLGTGQVLDDYAKRRARRDLSALLERAPKQARVRIGHETCTVPVAEITVGQTVIVASGEVVPVDGRLLGDGEFDESALTGEALPVRRARGEPVCSGVVNAGRATELTATAPADESAYAGVVRLAEQAAAESAPVVRLADRAAAVFLPVAVVIAAAAWVLTDDPVRAVAVLVTATPCPLLLAAPIAITAGMSRASRLGVVVKHGGALEALGRARTAVLDKTGTVTIGQPAVTDVLTAPGFTTQRVLELAAAVEQLSPHVLAAAVVRAAGSVPPAEQVEEQPGVGAAGLVDGRQVTVGKPSAEVLPEWARAAVRRAELDMASMIWVSLDGEPIGVLLARDEIRPDAARTLRRLRMAGIERIVLLTGDRLDNAQDVGTMLGLDELRAQCSPVDKVSRVREERSRAVTLMVGDGINDAPALAAADVGIGLAGRDATAAARAADAVITDGRIARLADAVEAAARAHRIAVQSAGIGIALSFVAMAVAAFGRLAPAAGALVQEGIDVAVILNALRALLPARGRQSKAVAEVLHRFAGEHEHLLPARQAVRRAADDLSAGLTPQAEQSVRRAYRLMSDVLLPHERAEDRDLYPFVAKLLGGPEATQTMSRGHAEIERHVRRLGRHLSAADRLDPDQVDDLRATLYGLDAILTLHFAQEEEDYFTLVR